MNGRHFLLVDLGSSLFGSANMKIIDIDGSVFDLLGLGY